jgi:hypothetical protein
MADDNDGDDEDDDDDEDVGSGISSNNLHKPHNII